MLSLPITRPASAPLAPVQRKCECGTSARSPGACPTCEREPVQLQRKLEIGPVDDPLEREADRIADGLFGGGSVDFSQIPVSVQRNGGTAGASAGIAPPSVNRVLSEPGCPLDAAVRRDLEPRFGRDFSQVRIHDGAAAGESAREVGAAAYTVANDIVFRPGRYAPTSGDGRRLLAHELVHVLQQGTSSPGSASSRADSTILRRQEEAAPQGGGAIGSALQDPKMAIAAAMGMAFLEHLAEKPGTGALYTSTARKCPAKFCDPFESRILARVDLEIAAPLLLAGIAMNVDPRVVPLWADYMTGGTGMQDLTSRFGPDFTASKRTKKSTELLHAALLEHLWLNGPNLIGNASSAKILFRTGQAGAPPPLAKLFSELGAPSGDNTMNFNNPKEIPGNIAGGVGREQGSYGIGARPSPVNDLRTAQIEAELARTPDGLLVTPTIGFTVVDTIDLCPGDCGGSKELIATVPLSRFEATGLVGDVPFLVEFPAPAASAPQFLVPLPENGPPVSAPSTGPSDAPKTQKR